MTVRRLDEEGDIVTSGVQFLTGREEIAQTISTRLKLFAGEYFRDITDGTPWFEKILPKNTSLSLKNSIIKNRILQTEGVSRMIAFSADYDIDSRRYDIKTTVVTTFGELTINEQGIL